MTAVQEKYKFKRVEPHFQILATRSASKEGTETAVALPHSWECTKEPISALCQIMVVRESSELEQNYGIFRTKNVEVEVVPVVDLIAYKSFLVGNATQVNIEMIYDLIV